MALVRTEKGHELLTPPSPSTINCMKQGVWIKKCKIVPLLAGQGRECVAGCMRQEMYLSCRRLVIANLPRTTELAEEGNWLALRKLKASMEES